MKAEKCKICNLKIDDVSYRRGCAKCSKCIYIIRRDYMLNYMKSDKAKAKRKQYEEKRKQKKRLIREQKLRIKQEKLDKIKKDKYDRFFGQLEPKDFKIIIW